MIRPIKDDTETSVTLNFQVTVPLRTILALNVVNHEEVLIAPLPNPAEAVARMLTGELDPQEMVTVFLQSMWTTASMAAKSEADPDDMPEPGPLPYC